MIAPPDGAGPAGGDWSGLAATDPAARTRALAGLIAAGQAATPALLAALAGGDADVRARAAQGLAEVGDPAAAPALAAALADAAPAVRGRAAQGLAALGDARAVAALVQTLDDLPDLLHAPHSVATYVLIARGPAVLPAVLPLLDAPAAITRQRAWLVWQTVVQAMPEAAQAGWPVLWRAMGAYAPSAEAAARGAAVDAWRRWLAELSPAARARPPRAARAPASDW